MYKYAYSWVSKGVSISSVLRILGLKRSTYFRYVKIVKQGCKPKHKSNGNTPGYSYDVSGKRVSDLVIQKDILEIRNDDVGQYYGYKKITHSLRKQYGLVINKKKVYRLCKNLKVLKPVKREKSVHKRICRNHKIIGSNQLWEMDMKYVYIAGTREVAYLTSIIDVFDRNILAYDLAFSANKEQAKKVLIEAMFNREITAESKERPVLRTDNGSQFIAGDFEKECSKNNIEHERIPVHSPNYDAHIESYHRYLEDECLSGRLFKDFKEAEEVIDDYVYKYNTKRIHSSLNYCSPYEFFKAKGSNFKNNLVVSL